MGTAAPSPPTSPAAAAAARPRPRPAPAEVALFAIGLLVGLSPFAGGFYDIGWWAPIGLGAIVVVIAVAIARPPRLDGVALLAIGSLLGLAVLSLLSTAWAHADDRAFVEGDRWLALATLLAAILLLAGDRRSAVAGLAGALAGSAAIALWILGRSLAGDGADLFFAGRLSEPLDYSNGLAVHLLFGFWGAVALAERLRRRPVWAGVAAGAAALLAAVVVLAQSRGPLLAFALSIAVLLGAVPGRVRRAWLLIAVAAGLAPVLDTLLDLYSARVLPQSDVRAAALAACAGAVLAGVLWGAATALGSRLRTVAVAGLVVLAALVLAAGLLRAGSLLDRADRQWQSFKASQSAGEGTRLLSGTSNRYDYWRVALDAFADAPVGGHGAGNYAEQWFLRRQTGESIRQPHGLAFQTLAELGIAGAACLVGLLVAVALALWRAVRAGARTEAVAGGGVVVLWLAATQIDWLHLMPGVTGVALLGLAVLLAAGAPERRPRRAPRALVVAAAVVAVLGAATVTRDWLAERAYQDARAASGTRAKLGHTADALSLQPAHASAAYLRAAAYSSLGALDQARAELEKALRRNARDYVPWVLLGDLETRAGRPQQARAAYERARALNPRDPELAQG